jgi:hypothetical protein
MKRTPSLLASLRIANLAAQPAVGVATTKPNIVNFLATDLRQEISRQTTTVNSSPAMLNADMSEYVPVVTRQAAQE